MKNKDLIKIIIDVICGAILVGFVSYSTILFESNPDYLKIVAYLWAVPLLYFYFLYVIYPQGTSAIKSFTIHGLLGVLLTTFIMFITYFLIIYKVDINTIMILNILYGIICLFIYFYLKLYKKF